MSATITAEPTQRIARRMDEQRLLLQRQFAPKPPQQPDAAAEATPEGAMQPYQPRSYLMRILVANPQLLQRAAVVAVTTALGARYSSWAMRLIGLVLAARRR